MVFPFVKGVSLDSGVSVFAYKQFVTFCRCMGMKNIFLRNPGYDTSFYLIFQSLLILLHFTYHVVSLYWDFFCIMLDIAFENDAVAGNWCALVRAQQAAGSRQQI
jgi:hypothetical protein